MKEKGLVARYKALPITVKATLWSMICGTLQRCVSLITTPIFTRLLTTTQYGQYTAYTSWMNIITMITTFNLAYAVFNKGMSKYPDDRDGYTSSMLGTTTVLTAIWLLVYLCFHKYINSITELSTDLMILMFVEILFYQSISFWTLRQRYEYRYRSVIFITLATVILNAIIGIAAVYLSTERGIARIISSALVNTAFGVAIFILVFAKGKKFLVKEYVKFAVVFNIPLIPHYLSTYILEQADRIMIQKMCGLSDVGVYGVAYSIGLVMKIFTTSINQSLTPWEYQSLEEKRFDNIRKKTTPIMMIVVIALLAFMLIVPEAMRILVSEQYYEAIYVIPSVTASVFFLFTYNWYSNIEFYYDANKFTMIMSSIGAVLNIILNYIFINIFGYIAAGYTTLACYVIFSLGHFAYSQHVAEKNEGQKIFDPKVILGISLFMIFSSVAITMTYRITLVRYCLIVLVVVVAIIKKNSIKELLNQILKRSIQ